MTSDDGQEMTVGELKLLAVNVEEKTMEKVVGGLLLRICFNIYLFQAHLLGLVIVAL